MGFEWNLTPEALAAALSPEDEAAVQAARLQAEVEALTAKLAVPPEEPVALPPEPSESQEPLAPVSDEVTERIYYMQATQNEAIDKYADSVASLVARVTDGDLRACIMGRALAGMDVDSAILNQAWSLESLSIPQRGDRVREENGAIGTVVAIRSLKEVIVKWDHVPRAMRAAIHLLSPAGVEGDE